MRMGAIRVRRRKLRESIDHHPQTRPMILFIQPIFFQPIVCVWFAMLIVPRHVLFATRISAIPIFMHVLSVITSIAAAVWMTTVPTVTGPIPILLPN
jgi:hypothetical protein